MSRDLNDCTSPILIAFGNPLLDLCVQLSDDSILQQFGLADDSAKEVNAPEYESLVKAVDRYPQKISPGGSALNTLRIFQWLWEKPNSSAFLGAIGKDKTGQILSSIVAQSGVSARFIEHLSLCTGAAISLIHGDLRSLVAHVGAANVYKANDFHEEDLIVNAYLVYIENYFFVHSADVIWKIVNLCKMNGVAIAFNLSGSYLFGTMDEDICKLVSYANIIFGNESEFQALASAMGQQYHKLSQFAEHLCDSGIKVSPDVPVCATKALKLNNLEKTGKVVVMTRGHHPVLCASASQDKDSCVFETPVLSLERGVIDTTGAGDAFVAGFFKGLFQNLTLQQCVYVGCYASAEIIQQVGCLTPNSLPLSLNEIEKHFKLN